MASFFTDLAKSFVERGINRAIEESRYICCFKCIAEEFEKERVSLEAEKNTVGQRIKVATRKGEDIQANARHWEEEADKLIEKDTVIEQNCFFGLSPDCIWRYRRGKELADKTKLIKRMMENGDKLENVGLPACPPGIERYSSQHYISFKSRELKYKQLLDALMSESNYLTGLHGMGGTGKTTLTKEVGKQLKQSEQFARVIDATVSYTPDIKKIQDEIAGSLGVNLNDCNESDRPKKLLSRLTNGEKILVILDDVWDTGGDRDLNPPLDFDAIGIPKCDNHRGCRVLMTTRSKRVLNKMECDTIIELELLSEEEAWSMFQHYAGLSNTTASTCLIEMGRKIAKECKRLPLAIAPIARSLKGKQHKEEWIVTLKSLQNPVPFMRSTVDDCLVGVYNCLKCSYDYLKDEKAKSLFLLCSVFPEDAVIGMGIITRLAIAVGIFGDDYDSYDDARSQVVVAKNKLLSSCLLLETDEGGVRMHDLVREVAQSIANKEIQTVQLSNKNNKSFFEREKNIKYLFSGGNDMDVFSSTFDGSKLEILISFFYVDRDRCNEEVSSLLFENNIGRLRALYLHQLNWSPLALSLPLSIQSTNIRSLLVGDVDLGDISVLGNMQSLETLDLIGCKIYELPCEITKLENFRLLKLENCEIRRNDPFEVIHGCSSLEELYFVDSFNKYCREITFSKLQRYHVCRGMRFSERNKPQSKFVSYDGDKGVCFFSKETLEYCMQTTEVLKLRDTKGGWRSIIPEIVPIDEGMNDLIELSLCDISQLQYLIDTTGHSHCVPNVFSKLVELELDRMGNLEEICIGPLSVESLKNLEEIRINDCSNLRSFFKCKLNLCRLKSMTVTSCPMLVSMFQLSTSQSLVSLEELRIVNCERLENIIMVDGEDESGELIVNSDNNINSRRSMFPKLETLQIFGCRRLEYIFSQYVELDSLKEMDLSGLPNFVDIFPHPTASSSSTSIGASMVLDPIICKKSFWTHICCYKHTSKATTTSTKVPFVFEDHLHDYSLEELESNSYTTWKRAQCLSRQSHIMCYIKDIKLSYIFNIKSVFILSITPTMLLETLTIRSCDELKHIVVDTRDDCGGNNLSNVFPKLTRLSVDSCKQLEYIFGQYNAPDDQSDDNQIHLHLPVLEQLHLYGLPSLIAVCPKKYRTTFSRCIRLDLAECSSQVATKSVGDFIIPLVSRLPESTIIKELIGSTEQFCALETLCVQFIRVENIFCLDEKNGQRMNLKLQSIRIFNMPDLTCLFLGPRNSFCFQNLTSIEIEKCEKLEMIFSISIARCLPQLVNLRIEECNELKHIIEDDDTVNQNMSSSHSPMTYFPKLEMIFVIKCNKLKYIFPFFACKRLPKLSVIMIRKADELEEIFRSTEGDHKVEISNLKVVVFENLPSLCQIPRIQFQEKNFFYVEKCQKLSLTSTDQHRSINFDDVYKWDFGSGTCDMKWRDYLTRQIQQLYSDSNPRTITSEDAEEIFRSMFFGHQSCLTETENQSIQEDSISTSEEAITTDLSTNSERRKKSPTQLVSSKQEDFNISVEEGTTSSTHLNSIGSSSCPLINAELKTSPPDNNGDNQIFIPSLSIATEDVVNMKDSCETAKTNDFVVEPEVEVEVVSAHELTSLPLQEHELLHEQSIMNKTTYSLAETDSTIKPFQFHGDNDIKRNDEEGTTFANNAKTIISSTHSKSVSSSSRLSFTSKCKTSSEGNGDCQIAMPSFSSSMEDVDIRGSQKSSIETYDQVFLNDGAAVKISLDIQNQKQLSISKENEIGVLEPKPSSSIPFVVASRSPSIPPGGNPPQIVKDLSSSSLIIRELEQLVLNKQLASENISLLTDFLVKHPSVRLTNNSPTNKYKGYAYNCLAELLKFLQTHSVLDVLSSNHFEFVELLQDTQSFAFDKEWLDGVERRVFFHGLQVPQDQDALQKLVHSKQQVTKEIEMLRLKIDIFSQQLEDLKLQLESSEATLKSINKQEEQGLESRAALSAPIGY